MENRNESSSSPALITYSVESALEVLNGYTRVRLYDLLKNREIESYKDGKRRIIVGDSLRQYVARRARPQSA